MLTSWVHLFCGWYGCFKANLCLVSKIGVIFFSFAGLAEALQKLVRQILHFNPKPQKGVGSCPTGSASPDFKAWFIKRIHICFLGPRKYIRLINPGGYGEADFEFEDVSEKFKSSVWSHFLLNRFHSVAKCRQCGHILRVTRGTTSTLRRHYDKCALKLQKFNEGQKMKDEHTD